MRNYRVSSPRAEKSAEGFREQKIGDLPVPEFCFFHKNGIYSTNCRVIWTQCFWPMGHHNTVLLALEGKYRRIELFSQNIWLGMQSEHNFYRFLSWVFRERAPCAPHFFQLCPLLMAIKVNKSQADTVRENISVQDLIVLWKTETNSGIF